MNRITFVLPQTRPSANQLSASVASALALLASPAHSDVIDANPGGGSFLMIGEQLGKCVGDADYARDMDLNIDGCINDLDLSLSARSVIIDVDSDGDTDTDDVLRVGERLWSCKENAMYAPAADLDSSGCINELDLRLSAAPLMPPDDVDGDSDVDTEDLLVFVDRLERCVNKVPYTPSADLNACGMDDADDGDDGNDLVEGQENRQLPGGGQGVGGAQGGGGGQGNPCAPLWDLTYLNMRIDATKKGIMDVVNVASAGFGGQLAAVKEVAKEVGGVTFVTSLETMITDQVAKKLAQVVAARSLIKVAGEVDKAMGNLHDAGTACMALAACEAVVNGKGGSLVLRNVLGRDIGKCVWNVNNGQVNRAYKFWGLRFVSPWGPKWVEDWEPR